MSKKKSQGDGVNLKGAVHNLLSDDINVLRESAPDITLPSEGTLKWRSERVLVTTGLKQIGALNANFRLWKPAKVLGKKTAQELYNALPESYVEHAQQVLQRVVQPGACQERYYIIPDAVALVARMKVFDLRHLLVPALEVSATDWRMCVGFIPARQLFGDFDVIKGEALLRNKWERCRPESGF